jgi:hypothetical protein
MSVHDRVKEVLTNRFKTIDAKLREASALKSDALALQMIRVGSAPIVIDGVRWTISNVMTVDLPAEIETLADGTPHVVAPSRCLRAKVKAMQGNQVLFDDTCIWSNPPISIVVGTEPNPNYDPQNPQMGPPNIPIISDDIDAAVIELLKALL